MSQGEAKKEEGWLMRRTVTLGIDPGLDGGFAVLEESDDCALRVVACDVLPTIETLQGKDQVDPIRLEDELRKYGPYTMLALEQVNSRPTDGHQGAFTFGRVLGRIETVILLNCWPYCNPTPQVWKRVVLTGSGISLAQDRLGQKAQAINYIKSRFPGTCLKKNAKCKVDHDGKAEALCLALYAHKYVKMQLGELPPTQAKGGAS